MKSLERLPSVVKYLLSQASAVTSIVSDKIRPIKSAQGDTYPLIIYRITNSNLEDSKDGNSNLANVIVEVEMYATSYDQLITLSTATRKALDGQSGTIDGHDIKRLKYETARDNYQDAAALDGVYMLQHDYLIIALID